MSKRVSRCDTWHRCQKQSRLATRDLVPLATQKILDKFRVICHTTASRSRLKSPSVAKNPLKKTNARAFEPASWWQLDPLQMMVRWGGGVELGRRNGSNIVVVLLILHIKTHILLQFWPGLLTFAPPRATLIKKRFVTISIWVSQRSGQSGLMKDQLFGFWIPSKGDIIGNRVLWPKLALESKRAPLFEEVFWEFLATTAGPKIEISRHLFFPR